MTPLADIPQELRTIDHWIVWRWTVREGKRTKPPFDPITDRPGDATDPRLWMAFDRATELLPRFDGLGFAVSDSPFAGVDLDHCLDEDGAIAPWAEAIVRRLNSYTEITPSGNGLRIWFRGELPAGRRRKGLIEMYDSGRYFTVTGRHLDGTPETLEDRSEEIAALHAEVFAEPKLNGKNGHITPTVTNLADDDILRMAMNARNGPAFAALFAGDISAYGDNDSDADLALCSKLAFWFGGDGPSVERVFRRSGLYREKWERADYRERTIAKALNRDTFFDPGANRNGHGGNGAAPPAGGGEPEEAPDPIHLLENDADPHRLARLFYSRPPQHPDGPTLVYWNEEWHRWNGLAWRVCPDKEVHAELTAFIKAEFDRIARGLNKPPLAVTTKVVGNAAQALRGLALLTLFDCPSQPEWIGPREPGEDLPRPCEVLPATNSLVHLPSFVAGEPAMLRPTPRFFSPTSLGYAFNPEVSEPKQWLKFLRSVWPDDQESIDALQEWMGYLLVPDTSQQKILMLIGPPRSGKGTIGRLIRALVGPGNVTAPTLSGMAMNFGLAPLIGKTLAIIHDARLSGRADSQTIVERLLSISGEDAQTIDRKHRESWTGRLPTRFILISNELPRLGDASGALPSRMVVLRMVETFYGREDLTLENRLLAERSAVLLWAIDGWARLRGRGNFTQPRSGLELLTELEDLASPVGTFIGEMCDVGPEENVEVKVLFAAWKAWCLENGRDHTSDAAGFGRNLRAVLPHIKTTQPRRGESRVRAFHGIGLRVNIPPKDPNRPPF
jgi:putative DNA primase/helicase